MLLRPNVTYTKCYLDQKLLDKKELDENELDKSELRRKCTRRNVTEPLLEWNLLEKSVKRPLCCTVSILQVYFTYFNNFYENQQLS